MQLSARKGRKISEVSNTVAPTNDNIMLHQVIIIGLWCLELWHQSFWFRW